MSPPGPVASYRVQLTPRFGFDDVAAQLGHLVALGVSHLYLSPIAEAVPGSDHGYDVVDHTRVRDELGGVEAFRRLLDAAAEHGLAVVFDHVPNHVSTARPDLMRPWWEMLRDGSEASGAAWFDVDRSGDPRVVLPVLGAPLDVVLAAGDVRLETGPGGEADGGHLVLYDSYRLPIAAGTAHLPLRDLLDAQHYRLVWWRSPERNVRRFFTIDDLVAVRVEVPAVAAIVDTLPAQWAAHPAFGGIRVDHVDGLARPHEYLESLRATIDAHAPGAWLLVEKIVAPGEWLPDSWPVDGTTGYEFGRVVDHLLVDPGAEEVLDRCWVDATGDDRTFDAIEHDARLEVLDGALAPDRRRTVATAVRALASSAPGLDASEIDAAVVGLTVAMPRYRTYLPDDPAAPAVLEQCRGVIVGDRPELATAVDAVVAAIIAPGSVEAEELRTRWQQLSGPAMAKGAEDRAFYRYLRLASLCEVGGEPGAFGITVDEFHEHQRVAAGCWPRAMLAGTTHDTKRSGDVRMRSAAITDVADEWAVVSAGWIDALRRRVPGIDGAALVHALQTAVTCPGIDSSRLHAFLVKSAREADLLTSWAEPDDAYEALLAEVAAAVPDGPGLADDIADWATRLDRPGRARSLAQTLLRLTCPGVPDIYQGTELFRYRLVDPDNRVPPDRAAIARVVERAAELDLRAAWRDDPEAARAVVYRRALALRREASGAFGPSATYDPVRADGAAADRVVAFCRGGAVVVVAAIRWTERDGWGDTSIELPRGRWADTLVDGAPERSGPTPVDVLLADAPIALLVSDTMQGCLQGVSDTRHVEAVEVAES
jgi:(1->4)-alpha-D-glucan 1-alpha-D-glucosylmutase